MIGAGVILLWLVGMSLSLGLVGGVSELEYVALLDWYNSTGGPSWYSSDGWLVGDPCLQHWKYIECNQNNEVINLGMNSNGLKGTIPRSILYLSQLRFMNLYGNELSGSVPSQIGALSKLYVLNLERNCLEGTVPYQLGELSFLVLL
eukprot:TRINITY_DN6501_c0_g1_i1.p1 TRINITY_DN6501_c0_g1~~TRINITY_DN6501_c0_g1_i1.p1  ORF type:complete len:147 (-),score=34.28 TRINITY_DN6501_c0_g1_i1:57-497(-)